MADVPPQNCAAIWTFFIFSADIAAWWLRWLEKFTKQFQNSCIHLEIQLYTLGIVLSFQDLTTQFLTFIDNLEDIFSDRKYGIQYQNFSLYLLNYISMAFF